MFLAGQTNRKVQTMEEILTRIWENLGGRIGGPLTFRFIIQPVISSILGVRDGIKDARAGKPAYFFSLVTDPTHRRDMISQGWHAVLKVFIFALVLDIAYQTFILKSFFPFEALIVAVLLAIIPYLVIRGPANRIARLWVRNKTISNSEKK